MQISDRQQQYSIRRWGYRMAVLCQSAYGVANRYRCRVCCEGWSASWAGQRARAGKGGWGRWDGGLSRESRGACWASWPSFFNLPSSGHSQVAPSRHRSQAAPVHRWASNADGLWWQGQRGALISCCLVVEQVEGGWLRGRWTKGEGRWRMAAQRQARRDDNRPPLIKTRRLWGGD